MTKLNLNSKQKFLLCFFLVLLFQLKRVFNIWFYEDLAAGDTASYFLDIYRLVYQGTTNPNWSPFYIGFYSGLFQIFKDAYITEIIARLLIIFTVTSLVFIIVHKLFNSSNLALFIGFWWASLPSIFDTLYDIHLFSAIIPFTAIAILFYNPDVRGRGISLSLLLLTMMLIRNEYIIAFSMWAMICLFFELKQIRINKSFNYKKYLTAYGLPLLLTFGIVFFFFNRTALTKERLAISAKQKHSLNICQIYAFNRQQQGDIWQGSPWTECQEIMLRDFQVEEPSIFEALHKNPQAMLSHFYWNFHLLPAGMQLALFNRYAGKSNPQYATAISNNYVWIPFSLMILAILWGIRLFWIEKVWKELWFQSKILGLLLLFITGVITTGIVMIMQRPRPSFMFNYTLLILILFAFSLFLTIRKKDLSSFNNIVPIFALVLLIMTPSYYNNNTLNRLSYKGQYFKKQYRRLKPHLWNVEKISILTYYADGSICQYSNKRNKNCSALSFQKIIAEKPKDIDFIDYINTLNVNFFYVTSDILSNPKLPNIKSDLLRKGWKKIDEGSDENGQWLIYTNRSTGQ